MRKLSAYTLLLLLPLLLNACKDDGYVYPPVKFEFLTAQSDANGAVISVLPDKGELMTVIEDRSNSKIESGTTKRVISNYEEVSSTEARIYGLALTVSPVPQPVASFKEGVKTDPAGMQSIWMGRDYLNMIVLVKGQDGKHLFHFVELQTGTDSGTGRKFVNLLLYHDAGDDFEAYTKRAYLSVPLSRYNVPGETVDIYFSLNTNDGIKTYSFEY